MKIAEDRRKPALLVLEDGRTFSGYSAGADGECGGEAVFNTSMTGYQEILTDPSYAGQIVVMTYPEIGNYGVNQEDMESSRPYLEGFVMRRGCTRHSNWRAKGSLREYLVEHGIVAISDIDTRALVRHLRHAGALRCMVSTRDLDPESLSQKCQTVISMVGLDLASRVTTPEKRSIPAKEENRGLHVVAYDFGIKENIIRQLVENGCRVTVVPAGTTAEDALALGPDGIFLSNGPGDPEPLTYAISNIQELLGRVSIWGICLGHQLLALALGGRTFKMKFGHHGGNHPVQNILKQRVEITCQNHGFCVDSESLKSQDVEITHFNLNDGTLEGFRHRRMPVLSVQYHPESSPGPHDSRYLFEEFIGLMEHHTKARL